MNLCDGLKNPEKSGVFFFQLLELSNFYKPSNILGKQKN